MKILDEPIMVKAGTKSKKIYFILSGNIHIMNCNGLYEYGILSDGSYFGDISLLLDQNEEFSYFYNPKTKKPITMLTIEDDKFLEICGKYPISKEALMKKSMEKK
jgi:CRP-like cAMP-binding protein